MIHTIKRYVALFVLVGLVSAVPALANTAKTKSAKKSQTFLVNVEGKKNLPTISRIVNRQETHKYQLNLQAGEKVSFTLRSDKRVSLKVQTQAGVKEISNEKYFQGVISAPGEYVIEISTDDISLYSLEISGN